MTDIAWLETGQRRKRRMDDDESSHDNSDDPSNAEHNTSKLKKVAWQEDDASPSDVGHSATSSHTVFSCNLLPHCSASATSFRNSVDLESHYQKHHANCCSTCNKIFPDSRFLHLHITEFHDPLVAVRRDRGERTVSRHKHATAKQTGITDSACLASGLHTRSV